MLANLQEFKKLNDLPANQYAATLIKEQGAAPSPHELHALQLLRIKQEEGRLNLNLRAGADLEQVLLNLIDLSSYDPQKAAKLLNLDDLPPDPDLIAELTERLNDLDQEQAV